MYTNISYPSPIAHSLWDEITSRILMHQKVGLELVPDEVLRMKMDAIAASKKAYSVFNQLIVESNNNRGSWEIKAEGLLSYSILIYHLQTLGLGPLIFFRDSFELPEKLPLLSAEERMEIEKALKYCLEARDIFKKIGSIGREITALIYIMGYYEDLGEMSKYESTKIKIEKMLGIFWVPNNIELFKKNVEEGSFRQQVYNGIRKEAIDDNDFQTANMSETDIEMQVECNCRTFNITDKKRIENVRKDVISYIMAAKFRITICRHFLLLQDMQHSFFKETLYIVDPNRIGVCKLAGHKSQISHNDPKFVINSFKKTYCNKCKFHEPLKKEVC